MKLQKIADNALKAMVMSYHESERDRFDMDFFLSLFPEETEKHISDALMVLEHDGLVSVFIADAIAYITTLHPAAIRDCEENTMLKKGYQYIKEIKSLIG